jgi:putative oxidoreductase
MQENDPRDLFAPILSSEVLTGILLLTARLFTTGIFVFYVVNGIVKPHVPSAVVYLLEAFLVVCIVLLALGYRTRFVAIMLAAFCVIALPLFHGSAGSAALLLSRGTLKDWALAGGLLFMFAYGPGPLSIDRYRSVSPVASDSLSTGLLLLAGRVMCSVLFFYFGINKIVHTPQMQTYMVKHNSHVPTNLIYLAIITQIVPPALVLLGYKTRYGALLLSGFCIIATTLFHSDFSNPSEVAQFLLDFGIAGGLLFMFAYGPGLLSLDAFQWRAKPEHKPQEALSGQA